MFAFVIKDTLTNELKQKNSISAFFNIKTTMGWGNGYVALAHNHKLYGKDYMDIEDELNCNIHGGLTYSAEMTGNQILNKGILISDASINRNATYWVIGFDTKHYGDTLKTCSREYVIQESLKLLKMLKEIK